MTLFLSDEEYARCSHDPSLIAQKADAYIRELYNQLETEKAQYDASSITAEQTCSILEQKYVSLKSEFTALQSQHSQLNSTLEERVSELAQIQADKHQIYLQSVLSLFLCSFTMLMVVFGYKYLLDAIGTVLVNFIACAERGLSSSFHVDDCML